jgi:hypothetical protein
LGDVGTNDVIQDPSELVCAVDHDEEGVTSSRGSRRRPVDDEALVVLLQVADQAIVIVPQVGSRRNLVRVNCIDLCTFDGHDNVARQDVAIYPHGNVLPMPRR